MDTQAISRNEVPHSLANILEPFIWISIREPYDAESDEMYKHIKISHHCQDTLILRFSDLIYEDYSEEFISEYQRINPKFRPFDNDTQKQIDNFIEMHNVRHCLINCYGGISRSAAVAAYIECKTGEEHWHQKYYQTKGKFPCFYICRILGLPIPEYTK